MTCALEQQPTVVFRMLSVFVMLAPERLSVLPVSMGPPPHSPWKTAYAERLSKSLRRECLDPVSFSPSGISGRCFLLHGFPLLSEPGTLS